MHVQTTVVKWILPVGSSRTDSAFPVDPASAVADPASAVAFPAVVACLRVAVASHLLAVACPVVAAAFLHLVVAACQADPACHSVVASQAVVVACRLVVACHLAAAVVVAVAACRPGEAAAGGCTLVVGWGTAVAGPVDLETHPLRIHLLTVHRTVRLDL